MLNLKQFLDQFEDALDLFQLSDDNDAIGSDFNFLRSSIENSMDFILLELRKIIEEESCLVHLNDTNIDYVCFGDFHGSLSDLVYVRNKFWKDRQALKKTHFVFLGKSI